MALAGNPGVPIERDLLLTRAFGYSERPGTQARTETSGSETASSRFRSSVAGHGGSGSAAGAGATHDDEDDGVAWTEEIPFRPTRAEEEAIDSARRTGRCSCTLCDL